LLFPTQIAGARLRAGQHDLAITCFYACSYAVSVFVIRACTHKNAIVLQSLAAANNVRGLRKMLRRFAAAVATSREGHRFSHEDRPQLSVELRMLRLRTIYRAENIGNVLKRVVNVCQQEFVNEVLGPLVTEFICNFGRENARPIQHAFHGGLLDPM
jgi:hypothetical protein